MPENYDFCGYATKNDLRCSDGRIIRKNAFRDCDGKIVPLVWNHRHDDPNNILGHALLKNVSDGVLAYGTFNDSDQGVSAKKLVDHGDIVSLSIYANQLKQNGSDVIHGMIREVSLVLAGANPGAYIETVLAHSDELNDEEEGTIWTGLEDLHIEHSELASNESELNEEHHDVSSDEPDELVDTGKTNDENSNEIMHAEEDGKTITDVLSTFTDKQRNAVTYLVATALGFDIENDSNEDTSPGENNETIEDVFNTLNEEQKKVAYYLIEEASKIIEEEKPNEEDTTEMKHNLFDNDRATEDNYISHADQEMIVAAAKSSRGSFKEVLSSYIDENYLQHDDDDTAPVSGYTEEALGYLFPEYKDVRPGAPELITNDQGWIDAFMNKVHKSPFSRLRTRQTDVRNITELRAKGYKKGTEKALTGNYSLIHRTTDPQTVYVKNALNRDDIIDLTDFDYVAYQYQIDRLMLNEELGLATMIGDGREDDAPDKISADKIRPIWLDDELYTIHVDVDLDATSNEIQGTDTGTYFGENFIYAESIVNALLYARENYKGSGKPDFYVDPHVLNVMLLARDRDGRRLYSTDTDIARALNVGNIYTVEQFANQTRTAGSGQNEKTKKLLGIVVNPADYAYGSTKGGQISHFTQFDIDFNQEKSLIETRVSGALTRIKSAIALEEDVTGNP